MSQATAVPGNDMGGGKRKPFLDPEALDFAPDLLAIQERPPARLPRALLLTLATLVVLLIVWSCIAKVDIVATAQGRLVPLTFTKVVQPADAGVVTNIYVKEGDEVKQGQLLLTLDKRSAQADSAALRKDVALRKLTLRRIEAELQEKPFLAAAGDPQELFGQVEAQYHARRQAYLDSIAEEAESLNKAKADLNGAEQELTKLEQTLPSYKKSAAAYQKLVDDGFMGAVAAADKTREAVEKEQDLKAQAANVQSLKASIAGSEKKIAAIRSQYHSQLQDERVDTVSQLNRSQQELEKSAVKEGDTEIRAPYDGVVKDLAITTNGAVVAAGSLLMNIVPREEPLQAEVLLNNEDVGFVVVGQPAKVKIAAYPFQEYGMIDGDVALVAADSMDPKQQQNSSQQQLSYRAIVHLKSRALVSARSGEKLPLTAGMLVTTEIGEGRRTVMEYLLSPVVKTVQEAARER